MLQQLLFRIVPQQPHESRIGLKRFSCCVTNDDTIAHAFENASVLLFRYEGFVVETGTFDGQSSLTGKPVKNLPLTRSELPVFAVTAAHEQDPYQTAASHERNHKHRTGHKSRQLLAGGFHGPPPLKAFEQIGKSVSLGFQGSLNLPFPK